MNCNICKIPGVMRQVVCEDCDTGKNFDKIFEVPKLKNKKECSLCHGEGVILFPVTMVVDYGDGPMNDVVDVSEKPCPECGGSKKCLI